MTKLLLIFLIALFPSAAIAGGRDRYAEGQVWSYRTRPGAEGSLLRIQRIDQDGPRTIYHVAVIGFRFRTPGLVGPLPHAPVSRETLDASVVDRQRDPGTFPSSDEGIAEWRRARGGVFTVTIAQVLDFIEQSFASGAPTS